MACCFLSQEQLNYKQRDEKTKRSFHSLLFVQDVAHLVYRRLPVFYLAGNGRYNASTACRGLRKDSVRCNADWHKIPQKPQLC